MNHKHKKDDLPNGVPIKQNYTAIELVVTKNSKDYEILKHILMPNSARGTIFLHSGWYPVNPRKRAYHFMIGYPDFEKFFKGLDDITPHTFNRFDNVIAADKLIYDLVFHLYGYFNFDR